MKQMKKKTKTNQKKPFQQCYVFLFPLLTMMNITLKSI